MGHWPLSALALTIGHGDSDLVASDFESFRRQELFFAFLNLLLIGALLALQAISRFVRGRPSASVIWVLMQAARDLKVPMRRISTDAMRTLLSYDFPGNIRELRNLVERACILSTADEITAENFPVAVAPRAVDVAIGRANPITPNEVAEMMPETLDLREFLTALEKALIQRALSATGGAQSEAARKLGLSRSDVSYKLGKHNIRTAAS